MMARKAKCGKCQTPNVEVCNGLCADCQQALDAWQYGSRTPMQFKLGDVLEDDLAAENELAGLRAAGGGRR